MTNAIFLDRDGVINRAIPDGYVLSRMLTGICNQAGRIILSSTVADIVQKDILDVRTITSDADRLAEEYIVESLQMELGCSILTEERGFIPAGGVVAIVDPLDGSMNYTHGTLGLYGVSIGLIESGRLVAGAIHLPAFGETVVAERGRGALWIREGTTTQLRMGCRVDLSDARVCIGRGSASPGVLAQPPLSTLVERCGEVVNFASCSVGLLCVATGRVDALVLPRQAQWDFAAGYCILNEIGKMKVYQEWKPVAEQRLTQNSMDADAHFDVVTARTLHLFDQIEEIL